MTQAGTPQYMDAGYGSSGIASISTGASTDHRVGAVAVDQSDRAVVAGTSGPLFNGAVTVSRLTKRGALDTSFGANGFRAVPSAAGPSEAQSLLVESDGSLVVGGMVNGGQFYLARLSGTGTIDTTFGTSGSVLEPDTSALGRVVALADGPGATIIAAGNSPTNVGGYIARLTSTGAFDPTFDGDGRRPLPARGIGGLTVQPDGKIVAVGGDFRVMRFNTNGTADGTFGTAGTANVPPQPFAGVTTDVVRRSDGSFLVAGSVYGRLGGYDYQVIRVTATGEMDTTFGQGGYLYVDFSDLAASGPGDGDQPKNIHLLPDGRFVVAGSTAADDSAARFLADGRPDASFGQGGRVDFGGARFGQHHGECCSALQSDGALLFASTSDFDSAYYHVAVVRVPGGVMGPMWRFKTLDGPGSAMGGIPADVGAGASSGVFGGQPHVFYHDATNGDLRHAWYDRAWHAETLDGGSSGPFGRINADVGSSTSTLVSGGQLQVFYYDQTNGALRHAWQDNTRWNFETLDGTAHAVAAGHIAGDVGSSVATNTYGLRVHVYYYDRTHGDLRHAWWTGTRWSAETLDGNATSTSGRVNRDVGRDISLVLFGGAPHAWYHDITNGDLRHAWWTGTRWNFETLDGKVNEPMTGRVKSDLGSFSTVVLYGTLPHVWYYDTAKGDLRHAWWTGTQWRFETLDGEGGLHGEALADVGTHTAAMLFGGSPSVWYRDGTNGDLRYARWTGTRWNFDSLDGFAGTKGRLNDNLGFDVAVLTLAGQPHAWYYDQTTGDLRHAWYS